MSRLVSGPVTVRVPATSANLGPGFDAFGLAMAFYDELTAEVLGGSGLEIDVAGEGADTVPRDASHLVVRAMQVGFEALGVAMPGLRLSCRNAIPHGRGLGSSSAAIVGGLSLARALVIGGGDALDQNALFALAARIEGHPDNVAPAVFGGFTIAYAEQDGSFSAVRLEVTSEVSFVVFVPSDPVETKVARGLLPSSVPHADASFNAGRTALVVAGLTGRPDVLLAATEDRLHHGYRAPAMPESADLIARLRADGIPAAISGAGPTVLAMISPQAEADVLGRAPQGWRAMALALDRIGVSDTP